MEKGTKYVQSRKRQGIGQRHHVMAKDEGKTRQVEKGKTRKHMDKNRNGDDWFTNCKESIIRQRLLHRKQGLIGKSTNDIDLPITDNYSVEKVKSINKLMDKTNLPTIDRDTQHGN